MERFGEKNFYKIEKLLLSPLANLSKSHKTSKYGGEVAEMGVLKITGSLLFLIGLALIFGPFEMPLQTSIDYHKEK